MVHMSSGGARRMANTCVLGGHQSGLTPCHRHTLQSARIRMAQSWAVLARCPDPVPSTPFISGASHTHTHTSPRMHKCTRTCTRTHTHVRTHVPTHTNTHTRSHTLTRTHTHKQTKTFGVQMNCHPDLRKNTVYANKQ